MLDVDQTLVQLLAMLVPSLSLQIELSCTFTRVPVSIFEFYLLNTFISESYYIFIVLV